MHQKKKPYLLTLNQKYRKYILKTLLKNYKQYISGQNLSKELKLTRTSIWKYIKNLRDEGYIIESCTKLGYRLISIPDLIIPHEIEENQNTKYLGKKVYHFKVVDSTNNIAQDLAKNGAPHGTLIIAETQNKGKGRYSRIWISPKGGLWFSIILKPNFSPDQASRITLVAAISVAQAIKSSFELDVSIKWPNDIYFKQKKVSGILTEMNAEIDKINFLIIGIGINVNNKLPLPILKTSLSLKNILKRKIDRTLLLKNILSQLEKNIEKLENTGFSYFLDEALKLCFILNKRIKVIIPNEIIIGKCKDIDENGNLILIEDNGNIRTIISGDIILLRNK
ncbi:MAG: biotin--[acetyl-CoA-carboxylase] ligase [Candidatus Firestonebacteria bacterium]|nr:biotin--[acetyl-CoA-carboxylase] ligase [Candidatus Firestonebacteria bacterium]